jgi:hypothetical protein
MLRVESAPNVEHEAQEDAADGMQASWRLRPSFISLARV